MLAISLTFLFKFSGYFIIMASILFLLPTPKIWSLYLTLLIISEICLLIEVALISFIFKLYHFVHFNANFAEYENRTRVYCLGSSHSATKLIPLIKKSKPVFNPPPNSGEKSALVFRAVYLNILAVFIHDDDNFFARLGHVKSFPYLPFPAGFAFQSCRFRRQFRISFFQTGPFFFYFLEFLNAYPAFFVHFNGGKNKRQKNDAKNCLQPHGINYFFKFSFFLKFSHKKYIMPPICLIQTAKENIGLCGRLSAFWRRLEWLPLLFYPCSHNLLHHFDKNIVRDVGSAFAELFHFFFSFFLFLPELHFSGYISAVKITGYVFFHRGDGAGRQNPPHGFGLDFDGK